MHIDMKCRMKYQTNKISKKTTTRQRVLYVSIIITPGKKQIGISAHKYTGSSEGFNSALKWSTLKESVRDLYIIFTHPHKQ